MNNDGSVFIQIAAYRDPELVPTVLDCLAKAKNPDKLRIGICWQHAEGDDIAQIAHLPQVRLIAVPYQESKGACWARAIAGELYDGEEFYMQIDSHHRFDEHWDAKIITMLTGLESDGVKKPLLTSYPPSYDPKNDPAGRAQGGVQIDFHMFSELSVWFTGSSQIKNWNSLTKPIRGRFFAGGFAFARESFQREVPNDPGYYFQGEEMNMSFRAFSHGYDIYHPHQPVVWHQYYRHEIPKHWKDHVSKPEEKEQKKITWDKLNQESYKRIKHFFSFSGYRYEDIEWGKFGRGTVRTLRDFEIYCGIDFRQKRITKNCLNKGEPLASWDRNMPDEEWNKLLLHMYEHTIELMPGTLTLDDYDFIYVGYERADGTSIYNVNLKDDALKALLAALQQPNVSYPLVTRFFADQMPHKWVFWPYSKSKKWIGRISGHMPKIVH